MALTSALLWLSVLALQTSLLFLTASVAPLGFSADLIRRDPPKTPRFRLRSRPLGYSTNSGSPFADTFYGPGEYVMKIQIGTPPVEILGIADTGSDLIWAQCLPCISCKKQEPPLFDPPKSSTYKDTTCGTSQCQSVKSVPCDTYDQGCPYEQTYADPNTFSIGIVGTDTFTLNSTSGEPFVMPRAAFGCGHNNNMADSTMSGIIGLGWGPSSLISQMGDAIVGLFSYCLGSKSSKINFGANAIVSGGSVATSLFRKQGPSPTAYFLNLDAVSVDGSRVETTGTSFHATDGNIIIDSGTTLTYLPGDYYSRVEEAVTRAVKAKEVLRGPDGELCYRSSNLEDFPVITLHFPGADLVLGRSNTNLMFSPGQICFTILPADGAAVFGNLAQANFLIGYDTQSDTIAFKPTNCSALYS